MKIERVEDKKFLITLTENEALKIADAKQCDLEYSRIYAQHIGRVLISFMIICCELPHVKQQPIETEL
ncbi:hypothetical protein ES703_105269 [subsurface metagenome]